MSELGFLVGRLAINYRALLAMSFLFYVAVRLLRRRSVFFVSVLLFTVYSLILLSGSSGLGGLLRLR